MAYLFDTHYGKCSLADDRTGVVVEWELGDYYNTSHYHTEGTLLNEEQVEKIVEAMEQYIKEEYQDMM